MTRMRISPALALILPLLLWGNPAANSQSRQEKKIVVEPKSPRQGWLGVGIRDMTKEEAKDLQVAAEEGALVTDVTPDSPADKGGIKKDDIIVEFNGRAIYDGDDLMKAVRRTKPGTAAAVVVERKDGKKTVQVTVGKQKRGTWNLAFGAPAPPLTRKLRFFHSTQTSGMQLMDLNPQLGEYFGAPDGKGVLVEEVEKESEGARAGFKAGDVILRIGDEKIEDLGDVADALEDLKEGEKAPVEILRKGARQTLSLTIEDNDISGTGPLPPGEGRALRKSLETLRENLGKIREEYGPQLRETMRELKRELRQKGNRERLELEHLRSLYSLPSTTI